MSETASDNLKQQEEADAKRHEGEQDSDRREIIAALHRIAEQQEASEKQEERAERLQRAIEKLSLRLEHRKFRVDVAGVIGIFLAAAVAILAIERGSADSRGQRIVLQRTLDEMQAEQRAWIAPLFVTVTAAAQIHGKPRYLAEVHFRNSGRDPAFGIAYNMRTGQLIPALSDIKSGDIRAGANPECAGLHPSKDGRTEFPGSQSDDAGVYSEPDNLDKINNGSELFVVQACFAYFTQSTVHYTPVCAYVAAQDLDKPLESRPIKFCADGNKAN